MFAYAQAGGRSPKEDGLKNADGGEARAAEQDVRT